MKSKRKISENVERLEVLAIIFYIALGISVIWALTIAVKLKFM